MKNTEKKFDFFFEKSGFSGILYMYSEQDNYFVRKQIMNIL